MKKIKLILSTLFISLTTFGQKLPDVTIEFENIISGAKQRCEQLNQMWPVNEQTILKDIAYLLNLKKDPIEKLFSIYYGNLTSWANLKAKFDYLKTYFKTGASGDIKNGVLKKYNDKNNGKVIYKQKEYTVEQLGNINFGIACKAIGIPVVISTCAAGCYQILAEQCLKPSTENIKKYLIAIKKAVSNQELRGACLDYSGDTKMIKMGYNWY